MGYHILTREQKELVAMVKDYGEKRIKPIVAEYDRTAEFPLEVVKAGIELGLNCVEIPEEYGGLGLGCKDAALMYEEVAKYDCGIGCVFTVTSAGVSAVMKVGSEAQKRLYQERIFDGGGIASFCLTEPTAGSDAAGVKTTAVKRGDDYVINGSKIFITNGGYADLYFVVAVTDKSAGTKGLSGFIVERDRAGVSIGTTFDKMGFRLANNVEVNFNDVVIPASNLVSKEGDGYKLAMMTLDGSRPLIGSIALGIGQRAFDEAVAYSKQRIQFGKPICANQGIQFLLAEMEMAMESSRCLVYHAAELIDSGVSAKLEGSIAKCMATDSAMRVTENAIQIFGGYGYMKDGPVEKLMRDAKLFQIVEGTNQIQKMVIAGQILGKY